MARTGCPAHRFPLTLAAGLLLLAPALRTHASPAFEPGENGYLSVTVLAARAGFGLDYAKRSGSGITAKLQDDFNLGGTTALPWYAAGLRLTERLSVGAEYLSYASNSEGEAKRKVKFGPFRFFVAAPTDYAYFAEVARGWLSYEHPLGEQTRAALFAGLSAVRLHLDANADGLGGKSERGAVAMPTLGARLSHGDPQLVRFSASADYSFAGFDRARGRALDVSLLAERRWEHGFVFGAGYRYYGMRFDADRRNYEARFDSSFRGPFVSVRWTF